MPKLIQKVYAITALQLRYHLFIQSLECTYENPFLCYRTRSVFFFFFSIFIHRLTKLNLQTLRSETKNSAAHTHTLLYMYLLIIELAYFLHIFQLSVTIDWHTPALNRSSIVCFVCETLSLRVYAHLNCHLYCLWHERAYVNIINHITIFN